MAITLVTTAGAADANAFVSLADANIYHKGRVHNPEWVNASGGDKSAAIVMATRSLCYHYNYVGTRTNETGALCWPRTGVLDKSAYDVNPNTIPQFMEDATAEFAFLLLGKDSTVTENISGGLQELVADDVSLKWNDSKTKYFPDIPKSVRKMVSYYVPAVATAGVVHLIRA